MKRTTMKILVIIVAILIAVGTGFLFMLPKVMANEHEHQEFIDKIIKLPEPRDDSETSIEEVLSKRRSIRAYKSEPLTLAEVSQLLWAAQGITSTARGFRTAPSGGALYPLEVYVVIGNVNGVTKSVYKYKPHAHELVKVRDKDVRKELAAAALRQTCIGAGSIVIVFSAIYERTTRKYGDRGIRYVHIEIGHAAQNIFLQAVSLDLGTVTVGAFRDDKVKNILNMPNEEHPLYLMPVGKI